MNKYNINDRNEPVRSPSTSSDEESVTLTPTGKHRIVNRSANKLHPPILSASYSRKNNSEGKMQKDFTDIFNEEKEKTIDCQVPPFLAKSKNDVYTNLHPFVLNKKNKINATQSLSSDSLNASRNHQPLQQQAQFLPNSETVTKDNNNNIISRHNSIDLSRPHHYTSNLINLTPEQRAEIAPFNYSGSVEHFSLDTYKNEEKLEEIAPFHYSSKRNEKSEPTPNISPQNRINNNNNNNNNNLFPFIPKKSNSVNTFNLSEEDRKIIAPFNDPNYKKPRTTSIDCDKNTLKQIAPFNDPELMQKSKSTVPLVYTNKDRNIIAPFNDPNFIMKRNTSLTMLSSVDKEKMKEIAPFNDPSMNKPSEKFKLDCKEEDRIKIAPFIDSVSPLSNNILRKIPSKKSLAEISASPIIVSQQQQQQQQFSINSSKTINISPEMRDIIAPFSSPKNNMLPPPFELEKYNDEEKLDEIAPFRMTNNSNLSMSPMKINTSQDILNNNNYNSNIFHSPISDHSTPTTSGRKTNLPPLTPVNDNNSNNANSESFQYKLNSDSCVIGPQRFTSRSPGHVTSSDITIDAASNNSPDQTSSILSSSSALKFSYKKPNKLPPLEPL